MTFDRAHWRNPRATIANNFQHNDIGYATHGAQQAVYALRMLDLRPSETEALDLLDVGCGTGRMSRIFAFLFKRVCGYDPVPQCIAAAKAECPGLPIPNLTFESDVGRVPMADIAVCINVMEHLEPHAAEMVLKIIETHLRPGGRYVMWYSIEHNSQTLGHRLTPAMRIEDAKLAINDNRTINVRVFRV